MAYAAVWLAVPLAFLATGPLVFDFPITAYVPGFDNDEIHYWHQILTFAQEGFRGGYYSVDELPAVARFTPFGTEGPVFTVFYGALARLFGWATWSPILYNCALLFLAMGCVLGGARPGLKTWALLALLLVTYWPLALMMPTIMQEPLHHVLALVLAALFYRLLTAEKPSVALGVAGMSWIGVMSLLRYTWSGMAAPYLLLANFGQRIWLVVFGSAMLAAASIAVGLWWSSPYPLYSLWGDISDPSVWFAKWALPNAVAFLQTNADPSMVVRLTPLGLVLRGQIAFLLLFAAGSLLYYRKRPDPGRRNLMLLIIFTLAHITAAQVLFYVIESYRDYRILGPYLLFCAVLLILFRFRWIPLLLIASNLLFLQQFLNHYDSRVIGGVSYVRPEGDLGKNDRRVLDAFTRSIEGKMVFQSGDGRWCNTLLVPFNSYRSTLVAVPAGIGLSAFLSPETTEYPLKSKYVIATNPAFMSKNGPVNLQPLAETSLGTLYFNQDSHCSPPPHG